MIKKIMPLGMTVLALIASCNKNNLFADVNAPPYDSNRETRYVDNLTVNNLNYYRSAIKKGEKEGIEEIKELVKTSKLEEAWAYLPRETKWIEIGEYETTEKSDRKAHSISVQFDMTYLNELIQKNDELIIYHFHPRDSNCLEDKINERKKQNKPMSEEEILEYKLTESIFSSLPSGFDMANMILNSMEFYKSKPNGKISYKVCSANGVVEFYLTEKGREKEGYRDMPPKNILLENMIMSMLYSELFVPPKYTEKTNEEIEHLCELMSKPGNFSLTFTPYK